jgi:hypothetical protein
MSVQEQQVNDALRVLDERHRLCRIERDEYRRLRRQLLDSLNNAGAERDTVRRAVPAGELPVGGATVLRHEAGEQKRGETRGRRIAVCLTLLGVAVGAAAVYWILTAG